MMHIMTPLIAAALAVCACTPSLAQDARSVRVTTHDLDLTTTTGQRQLELRIARAANQLCETVNPRFDAGVRVAQRLCRETTVASTLALVATKTRLAAR